MKKTYLLLLFTIVLITIGLIISCNLIDRPRTDLTELAQTDTGTKAIIYTEDKEIKFKRVLKREKETVGNAIFRIQTDINIGKKRELNEQESAIISQITGWLVRNQNSLWETTEVGEKNHYADGEKIATSIYHRIRYHKNGEYYYTNDWEFKKKELVHPLSLSVGGSGNAGNNNADNTYQVTKILFERGTARDYHNSELTTNTNKYENIVKAIRGISGTVLIGRAGHFSMSNGIAAGRIRLLNGEVVENHYYHRTARNRSIPVYISGNEITLKFYTEDFADFDFNDSYITVTISNSLRSPVRVLDNGRIEINYNQAITNIIQNVNITNVKIDYRHGKHRILGRNTYKQYANHEWEIRSYYSQF